MSNIKQYDFNGETVRIVPRDGEPWFVAKDVCDVLGLIPRDSVRYLEDDEKSYSQVEPNVSTAPPRQPMLIINEPGLYSLILRSRKERARAFKRWVTHEVLPSINKTGGYISNPDQLDPLEVAEKYVAALKAQREAENRLEAITPLTLGARWSEERRDGQLVWDLREAVAERLGTQPVKTIRILRRLHVFSQVGAGGGLVDPRWADLVFATTDSYTRADGTLVERPSNRIRVRPGKQAEFLDRLEEAWFNRED